MSDTDTFRPLRESTIGALIIRIGFWGILYIVPVWRPQSSVAIGKHSAHFRTRRHQLEAPTSNSLWGGTLVIDNTRLHSEELQEPINAVCDQETSKIQPRNQETTRRPRRERHDISSAPRGHQESTNAPRKHWLSTGAPEDHEEETTKRPPRDEQETSRRPPRHPAENSDILRRPSGHHPESLLSPQILAHFGMWDLEGHPESFPPNASAIQIFREPEVVCRIIHKPHSSSFLGFICRILQGSPKGPMGIYNESWPLGARSILGKQQDANDKYPQSGNAHVGCTLWKYEARILQNAVIVKEYALSYSRIDNDYDF